MGNRGSSSAREPTPTPSPPTRNGSQKTPEGGCGGGGGGGGGGASTSGGSGAPVDIAQPIQLSMHQKTLLRDAWKRMSKKGAGNIGSQIFRRMFRKNADVKTVFQRVTVIEGVFGFGLTPIQAFHHHSALFIEVLDTAIQSLDDLRPFTGRCVEYGAKHAPYTAYGFKPEMWDVFGECMTEAAREWEGWKTHRQALLAWTILVSYIVDRMRQGYESALRKQGFKQQRSMLQSASSISVELSDDASGSRRCRTPNGEGEEHGTPARHRLQQRSFSVATAQEDSCVERQSNGKRPSTCAPADDQKCCDE